MPHSGRKDNEGSQLEALIKVIRGCEYESEEARLEDVRKLDESGAFDAVQEKMGILIDKFDRGMYRID